MPGLLPVAAFAAALILGHAAFDAVPTIVAEREGGMGLGSALIVAQIFGVAGIAAGAVTAAHLVDRDRTSGAVVAGAFVHYVGMAAAGAAPSGALAWVTAAHGLAGAGLGILATCAFSIAAGLDTPARTAAIVMLLLAPLVARGLAGPLPQLGPAALILPAASVVALAVLTARRWVGLPASQKRVAADHRVATSARAALVGGVLVTVGVVAVLAGADPSRVSATMLAGPFGVALAALDGARVALVVGGLAVILGGAALLVARARTGITVPVAVAATALVAVAAAGVVALLSLAASPGAVPRPSPTVAVAALLASAIGLALGGLWLAGSRRPRSVAVAGSLVVAVAAAAGLLATQAGGAAGAGVVLPLAVASMAGFGSGLAAPALRRELADVAIPHRGLAAAMGVAAAASGAVLGSMVGNGAGLALLGGADETVATGALLLFAAAVGAAGVAGLLPALQSVSPPRSDRP